MFQPGFSSLMLGLGSALLVLAVIGCSPTPPPSEPIRAVKLVTVSLSGYESGFEFAGEVRPRIESQLAFRVGGKIVRRQAELGQRVQAGQVLAQLDAQDLRLAADAARAQLAAATTARDLAAAEYERFAALKDQNFISPAELERRESTLRSAQAQLQQAQAQLASQRNQSSYANLVADVAGVVTAVEAEPGQVVAAGAAVLRVAQDGQRDVVFSVPEDKVTSVRVGSPVTVRVWAGSAALAGRVREVSASPDPATRTYPVRVALEGQPPPLGATVYVSPSSLSQAGTPVIKLPTSALRQEGGVTAVWVLEPATMTLRSQPVQVVTADGNDAVIGTGLRPGMLVVSAGVHVLSPGQKVTIYQARLPASAGGAAPAAAVAPPGVAQAATLPSAPK
jgi:multidrug efflux system membrane fusion protein